MSSEKNKQGPDRRADHISAPNLLAFLFGYSSRESQVSLQNPSFEGFYLAKNTRYPLRPVHLRAVIDQLHAYEINQESV